MENFEEKFNKALIHKRDINLLDIQPGTSFSDLGLNSLDMIDVAIDFETIFDIAIPDEDIEKLKNIGEAKKYIKSMLKKSKTE
ncbi:MAG: phosphopantetheine-binding protein [Bacteroidia bacterium]